MSALLASCHHRHDAEPEPVDRAVLVYMAADNNLSSYTIGDIRQMLKGSEQLTSAQKLLLFVDKIDERPYFLEVSGGDSVRLGYRYGTDLRTSSAETLAEAMRVLVSRYPNAESYGLVLWGHATGWEIKDETAVAAARAESPRRAYGYDSGDGGSWMEIISMAEALQATPQLEFIFADCCAFQCIESAYELRHAAKYIIASAAEIPAAGAPYQTVLPALFSPSETFYEQAVDAYYEQEIQGYREPLSVIRTSALDDLAQATHAALSTPEPVDTLPDVSGLIYYFDNACFDMQDFMMRYVTDSDAYDAWKRVFDRAVIYKTYVPYWMTERHVSFWDFTVTEERYGGVSMFVPQDPTKRYNRSEYFSRMNRTISRMAWYGAAGLSDFGW